MDIESLDAELAAECAAAVAKPRAFVIPDSARAIDEKTLLAALFRLHERQAEEWNSIDDIAEAIWKRFGVASLEGLLARRGSYRHFEQTLGRELDACWNVAKPLLATALARGGRADLVIRVTPYITKAQLGELLTVCPKPAMTFSDEMLSLWCSVLAECEHPVSAALLEKLRSHRSTPVRIAATLSDPVGRTPARIAALLDSIGSKDDTGELEFLGEERELFETPEVQAAAVRLLARSRDALADAMTRNALVGLIRSASPALADWVRTARADAGLHPALLAILKRIRLPDDDEILRELERESAVNVARDARILLHKRGAAGGPFVDLSASDPTLIPDRIALTVVTAADVEEHWPTSREAVIEIALSDPDQLGVTFQHEGATWGAILAPRGEGLVWTDAVKLDDVVDVEDPDDATKARILLRVANYGRVMAEKSLGESTLADHEALIDAANLVRAPEVLVRVAEQLSALGAHEMALRVNLRLHKVLETFAPFFASYAIARPQKDAWNQRFRIAMAGQRFEYALELGQAIGPLPQARALAALGRFDEAAALTDTMGPAQEIANLGREWRAQAARNKSSAALTVGDVVTHAKFGAGTIVTLSGDKARIKFSDAERLLAVKFVARG